MGEKAKAFSEDDRRAVVFFGGSFVLHSLGRMVFKQ